MGKIDNYDLQQALESFAEELGLDYSSIREEIDGGKIKKDLLPGCGDLETEVTKDTKKVFTSTEPCLQYGLYGRSYISSRPSNPKQVATLLGKVNAIAEFLGLEFEVSPEKVVAEKVKAVKTKKGKK
jgi:hypothetical protein